jgi:hypothetical protein
MSAAYSAIVRSLENRPEWATFRIALRDQTSGSAYSRATRSLRAYVVRQVRQVHVMVAVGQKRV